MKKTEKLLTELLPVVNRIDRQRQELEDRIKDIDEEVTVTLRGGEMRLSTFSAEELLKATPELESLKKKKRKLKAALKQPNYADPEFRRLSIPYVRAVAEEKTSEATTIRNAIDKTETEIKESLEKVGKLRNDLYEVNQAWINDMYKVGIQGSELMPHDVIIDFNSKAKRYEALCNEYK